MNLPNKISLCRIFLIPVFMFFYMADFIPYGKLVAALVFALACLTDFIDGKIARSRGLVTNLGKFLDSIADKILVMAGIILLVAYPITANGGVSAPQPAIFPTYVGATVGIIILARELIISMLRQIAATKNIVLAADNFGRVKAAIQMVTLVYYFIYAFLIEEFYFAIDGVANTVISIVGYVLLAITLVFTVLSAINYLVKNRQVFKETK